MQNAAPATASTIVVRHGASLRQAISTMIGHRTRETPKLNEATAAHASADNQPRHSLRCSPAEAAATSASSEKKAACTCGVFSGTLTPAAFAVKNTNITANTERGKARS